MIISSSVNKESCRKIFADEGVKRVAFVYHLKIQDSEGYIKWLNESEKKNAGKRLYRVKADPVAREGMLVDELVIDEFSTINTALDCLSSFEKTLKQICSEYAVLVIVPEPSITFHLVKVISWFIRFFKGINDEGFPPANWKAENSSVWPDENQMSVAREQNLDEPLFVYNLNKYKTVADYKDAGENAEKISGKEAYERYSKIAGFELMRRGAFPVYGGKPICLFVSNDDSMLADRWDHFVFVRYPHRRNLLTMIESDEFHKGQAHRDAGIERVAIFMARNQTAA